MTNRELVAKEIELRLALEKANWEIEYAVANYYQARRALEDFTRDQAGRRAAELEQAGLPLF